VITDPPYYDSRSYSNLSDHFYVWHKRAIGHISKEHFSNALTPKRNEAIAAPYRHGGNRAAADAAYEGLMQKAFEEARRVLKANMPMVVVYAHKTTAGWVTLINSLRQAWFVVIEAWPVQMERKARQNAQETGALASSILLVTYKRETASVGDYEKEVRPDLERIVRERIETLWQMGIGGADLVIAAVGAGLRAFTRFARVEYANGEEVPPEKFLAEVEGVVLETLLEKIFGLSRSGVAGVDAASRFYVLWRYAYGARELDAGEAIVFAYPQSVELDGARGLTQGVRALVEKKKNKYQLRDFTERGQREDLGLPDEERNAAAAPLIDVLHRILWLLDHQPRSLPGFLDRAQPDRERLRLVAQALAGPALKGGESDTRTVTTTTAEASALGKLLANWRALIDARLEEFQLK
jgi:putative DNA methylase